MTKLKLGTIPDDKPVRLTIELAGATHRDLVAYAKALSQETGQTTIQAAALIGPMLSRFMATDRAFTRLRRVDPVSHQIKAARDNSKQPS